MVCHNYWTPGWNGFGHHVELHNLEAGDKQTLSILKVTFESVRVCECVCGRQKSVQPCEHVCVCVCACKVNCGKIEKCDTHD